MNTICYNGNIGGEIVSIFKNDYLEITVHNNKTFIQTFKLGFQLKDFDSILSMFPRIKLTNFGTLKNILTTVSDNPKEFGVWLPSVVLDISKDRMQASI